MPETPHNTPPPEAPKDYDNPVLLRETLDRALKAEKGREFPPAYLDFLKNDNPKLYAELSAANEAGRHKEVGPYTKDQLSKVIASINGYRTTQLIDEMIANGLDFAYYADFKFEEGKTTITIKTAAEELTLVQLGPADWLLGGVPYHTTSEEVFEDAKQIQVLIDKWQKGLTAGTSNPVSISPLGVISFDGGLYNMREADSAWNTVGADDPQKLAAYLNGIYARIQNS